MNTDKIATYLGFALKAGKVTLGVNAVRMLKKGVHCLILDGDTASNSRKEAEKLRTRFDCPMLEVKDLDALVRRQGYKLVAVRDASLAAAILKEAGGQGISVEGANG